MKLAVKMLGALLIFGMNTIAMSAESSGDGQVGDNAVPASATNHGSLKSAMLEIIGPYRLSGEMGPPGRGTGHNYFGMVIAADGNFAAVADDDSRVYVLKRNATTGRWRQVAQLNGETDSYFGISLAMLDGFLAIGAPGKDEVHILSHDAATDSWIEHEVLSGAGLSLTGAFGATVALSTAGSQMHLAVGAPTANSAAVFTYSGGAWRHEATVTPPGGPHPVGWLGFGSAIAIDDSRLVVGWPSNEHSGLTEAGTAYVFERRGSTWLHQHTLTAGALDSTYGWFGGGVDISGDLIAVGQPAYDNFQGAAHTFSFDRVANSWVQHSPLLATNGGSGDQLFGYVQLSGTRLIVGASGHDIGSTDSNEGAVFIYVPAGAGTWTLEEKLIGAADDKLHMAAATANILFVGAPMADHVDFPDRGHVRIFEHSGTAWNEIQRPIHAMIDAGEMFGYAVAFSGDTAVVAAAEQVDPLTNMFGVANVYVRGDHPGEWLWQAVLPYPLPHWSEPTFHGVAIDGDTIALGVPRRWDESVGVVPGEVYVYQRSGTTWTLQATLSNPTGQTEERFGWSVDLEGNTAVVGAKGADADKGAVYVFEREGTRWNLQAQLGAADGMPGDNLGWSVAIFENTIAAGAPGKDGYEGAVYLFEGAGTSWDPVATVAASDGQPNAQFGHAVALDAEILIVGAPGKSFGGVGWVGAAYAFGGSGATWAQKHTFAAPGPIVAGGFGTDVAIEGNHVVIGEPFSNTVHMFKPHGTDWSLHGSAIDTEDSRMGKSVAISRSQILTGAQVAGPNDGGRAYVLGEADDAIFADDFDLD